MNIQRALLFPCVVCLLTMMGADRAPREIAGTYNAHGTGVDGKEYTSTVTITKNADTYLIHWKFDGGGFDGVGLRDGDSLAVGWNNHNMAGVVLYKLHGDTLEGRWADGSSNGKSYTETLTLLSKG
jgi:hypothetical protein